MDEDELEKLREQKRQERQESSEVDTEEQQRAQIKNEASKYLTNEAVSRLGNIRAANPELAESVETQIVMLGRSGQIKEMNDTQLKEILKEIQGEKNKSQSNIKFRR